MITFKEWVLEAKGSGGDMVGSSHKSWGTNTALDYRQTMGSSGRFWDENMPLTHRAASGVITGIGGAFQQTLRDTGATPAAAAREFFPWESIDDKGSVYEYTIAGYIPKEMHEDQSKMLEYAKQMADKMRPGLMKHPTVAKLIQDGHNLGTYRHHIIYGKQGEPMWMISMKFPKFNVNTTADAESGEEIPTPHTIVK